MRWCIFAGRTYPRMMSGSMNIPRQQAKYIGDYSNGNIYLISNGLVGNGLAPVGTNYGGVPRRFIKKCWISFWKSAMIRS